MNKSLLDLVNSETDASSITEKAERLERLMPLSENRIQYVNPYTYRPPVGDLIETNEKEVPTATAATSWRHYAGRG